MNLVLDIGNTATKAALFEDDRLIECHVFYQASDLMRYIQKAEFRKSIVASVNEKVFKNVLEIFEPDIVFNAGIPIPLINEYKTPNTLGADRIAGVMGAYALFSDTSCLVIDAGTCITYDLLTAEGKYLGGMITPGPELKSKSLNNFTSALPLVDIEPIDDLFGDTTTKSILTGIVNGSVAEMEGLIATYSHNYHELKVILCGGWAKLFESKIKASIFVEPNLVLIGLNAVLKNNA